MYAEAEIPVEWLQDKDGKTVQVDHFWSQVPRVRTPHGSQKFSVLTKVLKCALTLSHGNADNERSLSENKKTLTKDRTNLSQVTVNGLRTTEDAIKSMDGLSNVEITKKMSSIKGACKAYYEHFEMEKKEAKKKQAASAAEVQRKKKKQEEEVRNLEQLKSESKNLNAREANAEKLLQSTSKFLDDGNKRMEKGIAENDVDEIQAAKKMIELAQETQKKAQDEFRAGHGEKRKIT